MRLERHTLTGYVSIRCEPNTNYTDRCTGKQIEASEAREVKAVYIYRSYTKG